MKKSQRKATEKYERKAYDKILVRCPHGTSERIRATGDTLNHFCNVAIIDRLNGTQSGTVQATPKPQAMPDTTFYDMP